MKDQGMPVATPVRGTVVTERAGVVLDGARTATDLAPVLAVHLLGSFSVAVDDVPVEPWRGGRTRSLFAYLLTHRQPWPSREMLMDLFWSGSSPRAARNSLNVAVHSLRRAFRAATDRPVIEFAANTYRLHPALRLWLDFEEFERRVQAGQRLESLGDIETAIRQYESAAGLYRGEFLADVPYDDWPALLRERLRLAHVNALDRLSTRYFEAGRYAVAADLCARTIRHDPCREQAHRRLMRCHSRLGHPHLALLQYRACADLLMNELGVRPSPVTQELYRRVRRHEPV